METPDKQDENDDDSKNCNEINDDEIQSEQKDIEDALKMKNFIRILQFIYKKYDDSD